MPKPSLLSKEQVIWINCALLALFVCRLGLGRYNFANEALQNLSIGLWLFLFVILAMVLLIGPKSITRTIGLTMAIPVGAVALFGSTGLAKMFDEHPDAVQVVGRSGDVTAELVQYNDVTYDQICRTFIELRLRRSVLHSLLEEQETLISVQPAFYAQAELVDQGRSIRFNSPALLERKAIERTFSTNWDEARKRGCETIKLKAQK